MFSSPFRRSNRSYSCEGMVMVGPQELRSFCDKDEEITYDTTAEEIEEQLRKDQHEYMQEGQKMLLADLERQRQRKACELKGTGGLANDVDEDRPVSPAVSMLGDFYEDWFGPANKEEHNQLNIKPNLESSNDGEWVERSLFNSTRTSASSMALSFMPWNWTTQTLPCPQTGFSEFSQDIDVLQEDLEDSDKMADEGGIRIPKNPVNSISDNWESDFESLSEASFLESSWCQCTPIENVERCELKAKPELKKSKQKPELQHASSYTSISSSNSNRVALIRKTCLMASRETLSEQDVTRASPNPEVEAN